MNVFNSTSASKESGFTLLEILIAITLLAFITIGIVNITENAALTKERTTEINENNLQIETAMSRFEWDFSQIYSPLYFSTVMNFNSAAQMNPGGNPGGVQSGSMDGTTGTLPQGGQTAALQSPQLQQYYEQLIQRFERNEHFMAVSKEGIPVPRFYAPDKSVFEFFTTSNRRKVQNQKQSHFAWVRYALAPQEPTEAEEQNPNIPKSLRSLVRYFSADDPYSDKRINIDDETRVKGAVLLRNVENLEFQYWDYEKRKWETSLRNIRGGESLIRGVRINITWYDSFGNQKTASRIFRTNWPMVTPGDQAAQPGLQGGVQGTTNSGNLQGQF